MSRDLYGKALKLGEVACVVYVVCVCVCVRVCVYACVLSGKAVKLGATSFRSFITLPTAIL